MKHLTSPGFNFSVILLPHSALFMKVRGILLLLFELSIAEDNIMLFLPGHLREYLGLPHPETASENLQHIL